MLNFPELMYMSDITTHCGIYSQLTPLFFLYRRSTLCEFDNNKEEHLKAWFGDDFQKSILSDYGCLRLMDAIKRTSTFLALIQKFVCTTNFYLVE